MKNPKEKNETIRSRSSAASEPDWAYRNSEGYPDPTAGPALARIYDEEMVQLRYLQECEKLLKKKHQKGRKQRKRWEHEVGVARYY